MKNKKPMANIRHIVLAFTILIGSITSIAWLNPAIGNGKLSVKATKFSGIINSLSLVSDSTKKSAKAAPKASMAVAKKAHPTTKANMRVYTKNGKTFYFSGMDDPKLDAMSKQMDEYAKQLDKYYGSADFKKMEEDLNAKGKEIDAFYNNPDLKRIEADQEKASKDFDAAYGDNSQVEKLGKQMDAVGKKMDTYYNSAEFKQINAKLMKKYGIPENYNYSSSGYKHDANYDKYQAELKQNIPAEVTAYGDQMKSLGQQMRDHFNTPERKAANEKMKLMGDSMRKAFNNPQIKMQQEQMRKLGEQMRNYTSNPDVKKIQQQMKELGEKMHEYTNSPEFKKRTEEWKASMKAANWDFNMDHDFNFEIPPIPPVPAVDVAPIVNVAPAPTPAAVIAPVPPVPPVSPVSKP